jgi:hypothetical protein
LELGGNAAGASDYKYFWNNNAFSELVTSDRLKVQPLEYHDKDGSFGNKDLSLEDSVTIRIRLKGEKTTINKYNSLIIDLVK